MVSTEEKQISIALSSEYMKQVPPIKGGRYYEVNGEKYQSVTRLINNTLRNFGVERWKDTWVKDQLSFYNGKKITPSLATTIVTAADNELKR